MATASSITTTAITATAPSGKMKIDQLVGLYHARTNGGTLFRWACNVVAVVLFLFVAMTISEHFSRVVQPKGGPTADELRTY